MKAIRITDERGTRMTTRLFERDSKNVVRCTRCWIGVKPDKNGLRLMRQHIRNRHRTGKQA